jgi:hypothetical protein
VTDLRSAMERERAAAVLAGTRLADPLECPLIEAVLKAALCSPPRGSQRPWVFGVEMVGPDWLFGTRRRAWPVPDLMVLARVVHHSYQGLGVIWTRKEHKAWCSREVTLPWLASSILSGEVTDHRWA